MRKRKSRSNRILEAIHKRQLNSGKDVIFNSKLAKRVFVKENRSLTSREFDSNVMRIARKLRENEYLSGFNGNFVLTDKGREKLS